MTYVAADGPPDVDAKHAWAPATGSAPPVLGNWTADPIDYPFIHVRQIANWRAAPEADNFSEPKSYGPGEIPLAGEKLGKTLVYELQVKADTREELANTITGLLKGFCTDMSGLGTMTVTPWSSIGGVVWQYKARVLGFEPDPVPEYLPGVTGPWRREAQLTLRMFDPYFYTPNLAGTAYL